MSDDFCTHSLWEIDTASGPAPVLRCVGCKKEEPFPPHAFELDPFKIAAHDAWIVSPISDRCKRCRFKRDHEWHPPGAPLLETKYPLYKG